MRDAPTELAATDSAPINTEAPLGKPSRTAPEIAADPPGPSRSLAVRIHRSILRLAAGRIRALHVDVREDMIVLEGRCATFYCKQLAQQVAMELADDELVHNHIEVVIR